MRKPVGFRLTERTRERLDEIVRRARDAGESYPDNRTDVVTLAIDRLWEQTRPSDVSSEDPGRGPGR